VLLVFKLSIHSEEDCLRGELGAWYQKHPEDVKQIIPVMARKSISPLHAASYLCQGPPCSHSIVTR